MTNGIIAWWCYGITEDHGGEATNIRSVKVLPQLAL